MLSRSAEPPNDRLKPSMSAETVMIWDSSPWMKLMLTVSAFSSLGTMADGMVSLDERHFLLYFAWARDCCGVFGWQRFVVISEPAEFMKNRRTKIILVHVR